MAATRHGLCKLFTRGSFRKNGEKAGLETCISHLLHEELPLCLDLFRPLRLLLDPEQCLDADEFVYPPQPAHE